MGNQISKVASYYSNTPTNFRKYGWKRDKLDIRDHTNKIPVFITHDDSVDLRDKCPGIYNQGELGSCTANAIAAAYEFDEIKQNENLLFIPSRLFIYYNEREMENTTEIDNGAEIRDGIKTINKIGVCPETLWPYDISKFTNKPTADCYENAKHHKSVKYHRLNNSLDELKSTLEEGYPFVFGFAVYESFESKEVADTGIMVMPSKKEKLLGGHAVMGVGYNDETRCFIIRNSWGIDWGDKGYFYMPYDFITSKNLCSDFWIIEVIRDE